MCSSGNFDVSVFEMYGVAGKSIDLVKMELDRVLGIDFQLHECELYGYYYYFVNGIGEKFSLFLNRKDKDSYKNEYKEFDVLLKIGCVKPPEIMSNILKAVGNSVVPLSRTEMYTDIVKMFKYEDGQLRLVREVAR